MFGMDYNEGFQFSRSKNLQIQSHWAPITPAKPAPTRRTLVPCNGQQNFGAETSRTNDMHAAVGRGGSNFMQGCGISGSSNRHDYLNNSMYLGQSDAVTLANAFESQSAKSSMQLLSNAANEWNENASYMNLMNFIESREVNRPPMSFTESMKSLGGSVSSTNVLQLNSRAVEITASNDQLLLCRRMALEHGVPNCDHFQHEVSAQGFPCIPNLNFAPDQSMSHNISNAIRCPTTPLQFQNNIFPKSFQLPLEIPDDNEAEENLAHETEQLNAAGSSLEFMRRYSQCSSTPPLQENSRSAEQFHPIREVINLLDDNADETSVWNINPQSQIALSEQVELQFSRPAVSSLGSLPNSSTLQSGVVLPQQPQSEEVPTATSEKDNAALLDTDKRNSLGDNGIDLNKMPKQKARRKKHRPKVIREGKQARPTKPKTPTPLTPKSMRNIDPSTGKRKYTRRRNIEDTPEKSSNVVGEHSDLPNKGRIKSIKRRLNFDLETSEPRYGVEHQTVIHTQEGTSQAGNSCLAGTTCNLTSKSTMQLGQELEVVEDNLNCGETVDPFCSVNQTASEQLRLAENQSFPRHVLNSCQTMPEKPTKYYPSTGESTTCSLIILTKNNDNLTLAANHEGFSESNKSEVYSPGANCSILNQAKNVCIHNYDSHACPGKTDDMISAFQSAKSSCKRQRTVDELTGFSQTADPSLPRVPKVGWRNEQSVLYPCEFLTFADVQRMLFLELQKAAGGDTSSDQTQNSIGMIAEAFDRPLTLTEHSNTTTPASGLEVTNGRNHIPLTPVKSCNGNIRWNSEAQFGADTQQSSKAKLKARGYRRKDRVEQVNSVSSNTNEGLRRGFKAAMHGSITSERSPKKNVLATELVRVESGYSDSSSGDLLLQDRFPLGDPIDNIILMLSRLTIKEVIHGANLDIQKAIVPYDGGGAIVPYQGKKRHPRPKVDLDPETERVWRLLMGKEFSDGVQDMTTDKEKWWEEERLVFRGRVDSFIARMHLVQGDRRFSKWKGSVVDSVVGVFLTQNVSDHLSSSAFMALAARFPPKSRDNCSDTSVRKVASSKEQEDCSINLVGTQWNDLISGKQLHDHVPISNIIESENCYGTESYGSNNGSSEITKLKYVERHETLQEIGLDSPDSRSSIQVGVRDPNAPEIVERWPLDEVLSSQNSVVSSFNSSINPDTISPAKCHGESSCFASRHSENLTCTPDNSDKRVTYSFISASSGFNNQAKNVPTDTFAATQMPCHFYQLPAAEVVGLRNTNGLSDLDMSYQHSIPSEVIHFDKFRSSVIASQISVNLPKKDTSKQGLAVFHESNEPTSDLCTQTSKSSINLFTTSKEGEGIGEQLYYNSTLHPAITMPSEEVQQASQHHNLTHDFSRQQNSVILDETQENLFRVSQGAESILKDNVHSSKMDPPESQRAKIKETKIKGDSDRKKTFDWDSLRREVEKINTKKERTHDRMDSLDWVALRCADVKEISETIRERGMNNMLAERIKEFLDRIVRDHGSIDLEWLRDIEPDKAKDYLLSIRGLGLKSVECVRLLTLHHLAFPVDTNVGRICVRLGWVPLQPLPESLQLHLLELYPVLETIQKYIWPRLCKLDQRTLYELHYQLITFGKVFCTKSKPNCNACPMRGECRHFASAFASARLALPGLEEKGIISSTVPISSQRDRAVDLNPLPQLEGSVNSHEVFLPDNNNPLIQEPTTPEFEHVETEESAIEDAFYHDVDEIPTIAINVEEFAQTLHDYMQENNMEVQEVQMSKALVALNPEAASIPAPKLKNVSRLRTEHYVYELPDSHPLLEGFDHREPDDPSSYLLAIWTPGENAQSIEPPQESCNSQETGEVCTRTTCFMCNSIREAQAQTVRGTILIPCRTAMKGSFPLNGTYFQVNEVFADHDTSRNPIDVPRECIWNLPRRTVYFGTSTPSIFKGLTTEQIQLCFWRGFVCVRGFDRKTRAPRPLYARLHFPASKTTRNKKAAPAAARPVE